MRALKIIIAGIIGFLLVLGLWQFGDAGYVEQWKKLSHPPQEVVALIPTGGPPLFIKASDGKIYRYSDWQNEGWIQESSPAKLIRPFEIAEPCNFSSPAFSLFSNAPKDIKDCLQEKTMYADGYVTSTFIIDRAGNVWEWQHARSAEGLTLLFCLSPLGLLIGLFIGVELTRKNKREEVQ